MSKFLFFGFICLTLTTNGFTKNLPEEEGVIGHWKFDTGKGTEVRNGSKHEHIGILYGPKWRVKDKSNYTLCFDGKDDYVLIKNSEKILDNTDGFTIEAWIKQESYWNYYAGPTPESRDNGSIQSVLSIINPSSKTNRLLFSIVRGQIVFGASYDINGHCTFQNIKGNCRIGGLVPLRKKTHVAVTYDGKTVSLFVNGSIVASKNCQGTIVLPDAPIQIGGYHMEEENTFFNGTIYEIRIYNKPITFSPESFNFVDTPYGAYLKASLPSIKTIIPLKTTVEMHHGVPTLFIDGKPKSALLCREHEPQFKTDYLANLAKNGVNIFHLDIGTGAFNPAIKNYSSLQDFYGKDYFGKFNGPPLEKIIQDIPESLWLMQINTTTYKRWNQQWCEEHPEEIALWPPDESIIKQAMERKEKIGRSSMIKGDRVSLCSEIWREETKKCLTELIKYLRKTYGDRIIGYSLYGPNEWGDYWDYSEPAQKSFRKWIKNKYKGDIYLLRKAWQDTTVNFDTLSIPDICELYTADCGIFYDPKKSQKIIDYLEYYPDMAREVIIDFAETIKNACEGESIVGVWGFSQIYPGWTSTLNGSIQATRRGLNIEKLIANPFIDFIALCPNYRERHAGGVYSPQLLPDTVLLNKKMFIEEDDTRTFLTPLHNDGRIHETTGDNFGQAKTLEETIAILKRNFAALLCKPGSGIWWYTIGDSPHMPLNHPEILETIKKFSNLATAFIGKNKKNSQIAIIFSQESFRYQKFNYLREDFIMRFAVESITRIGAPFDMYLDSDLNNPNFPFENYKLYIFANNFYLSDRARKIIKEKIQTKGKTVLWIYAPGFITDKGLSVEATSELTGIDLDMTPFELQKGLDVYLIDYSHPITKGLSTDLRFGTRNSLSPVFWSKDKTATILGEEVSTSPTIWTFRKPGLCFKKFPTWTSIWSGVPNIPSSLLRNIARYAGVHIYSDGDDQIFASEKLLAIHTRYAGERTIKLPGRYNVYDPFKQEYIGKNIEEFTIFIPAASTEMWVLE